MLKPQRKLVYLVTRRGEVLAVHSSLKSAHMHYGSVLKDCAEHGSFLGDRHYIAQREFLDETASRFYRREAQFIVGQDLEQIRLDPYEPVYAPTKGKRKIL